MKAIVHLKAGSCLQRAKEGSFIHIPLPCALQGPYWDKLSQPQLLRRTKLICASSEVAKTNTGTNDPYSSSLCHAACRHHHQCHWLEASRAAQNHQAPPVRQSPSQAAYLSLPLEQIKPQKRSTLRCEKVHKRPCWEGYHTIKPVDLITMSTIVPYPPKLRNQRILVLFLLCPRVHGAWIWWRRAWLTIPMLSASVKRTRVCCNLYSAKAPASSILYTKF